MSPSTTAVDPRNLVTEEDIKKVLEIDKGTNVTLKSWKVVDFTQIGDNFICLVTSVEVKYSTSQEEDCEVSYVVKLDPQGKAGLIPEAVPFFFTKECKFFEELVPLLNKELTSAGQKPLCVPRCFLVSLEEGKQLLYLEDLRPRGFKMLDKTNGLDKDHVTLVIQELARLHSASYLLKKNVFEGAAVSSKYEWLLKDFLTFSPSCKEIFLSFVNRGIDCSVIILETVSGYEKVVAWLKSVRPKTEYFLTSYMQSERFNSLCHGDCWTNNMLFRYSNNLPVEVMLLDLQVVREVSAACDLNYFLQTSVCGDVRKPNLDHFMSIYHSSYKEVLGRTNIPMPFTQEEIMQEYKDKNIFGLLFAITVVPLLFSESEDIPKNSDPGAFNTVLQSFNEVAKEKFHANSSCRLRFLSLFDELVETGLIS